MEPIKKPNKPQPKKVPVSKTNRNNNNNDGNVEIKHELVIPNFEEGDYKGPTDFSNWVIPGMGNFIVSLPEIIGRLLMGAYPKRKTLLCSLLETGK
jgi:hypothetical protein